MTPAYRGRPFPQHFCLPAGGWTSKRLNVRQYSSVSRIWRFEHFAEAGIPTVLPMEDLAADVERSTGRGRQDGAETLRSTC